MPLLVSYTITRSGRVASVWQAQRFCQPAVPLGSVVDTRVITVAGQRYVRPDS